MSRIALLLPWVCLCAFLSATACLGQGELTRQAVSLAEENRYEEANDVLMQALRTAESEDPVTWYVHAFVQKSLFVGRDGRNPDSAARIQATEAAVECARRGSRGDLESKRTDLLEFLAETHLEDARDAVRTSQPGEAGRARQHLRAYTDIRQHLDPRWDAEPDDVLLDQMLAEHAFTQAETLELTGAGAWFQWGRACYERAATKPTDRYRSLYNLAVHTYNQGVRQFKASEDDLDAVDSALKDAATLWNLAAQGLEDAIAEDGERTSGYEALAVVSEALLNQDRIEWCKSHLTELGDR